MYEVSFVRLNHYLCTFSLITMLFIIPWYISPCYSGISMHFCYLSESLLLGLQYPYVNTRILSWLMAEYHLHTIEKYISYKKIPLRLSLHCFVPSACDHRLCPGRKCRDLSGQTPDVECYCDPGRTGMACEISTNGWIMWMFDIVRPG